MKTIGIIQIAVMILNDAENGLTETRRKKANPRSMPLEYDFGRKIRISKMYDTTMILGHREAPPPQQAGYLLFCSV